MVPTDAGVVVSVVLPVYNGVPFIGEAVHSILRQSWRSFELIVVDNCSTDKTVAIVQSFRDPRIRIIRESRLGGPIAFNAGMRMARGRYVARMDADDVACQDRLKQQLHYLEARPDIGILGGQALKIDEKGRIIGRSRVPSVPAAVRQASRYAYPMVHPTLMYRRDVWNQLGEYQEFSPAADYDLLLRALERGVRVANLSNVVLKYRICSGSVSHGNRQRTVMFTLAVKRMHWLRKQGRFSDEQAMLERLRHTAMRQSIWFRTLDKYVYRMTSYRNIGMLKGATPMRIPIANLSIAAVSVLHPRMMQSLWAAYRAKRVMFRYQSRGHSELERDTCR